MSKGLFTSSGMSKMQSGLTLRDVTNRTYIVKRVKLKILIKQTFAVISNTNGKITFTNSIILMTSRDNNSLSATYIL